MKMLAGAALLAGGLTAGFLLRNFDTTEFVHPVPEVARVSVPTIVPTSSEIRPLTGNAAALADLVENESSFQNRLRLTEHVARLEEASMAGAINEALRLPMVHRDEALALIFARWSELNPVAAARYLRFMPKIKELGDLRKIVMAAWADKDPVAALDWAKNGESGSASNEAMSAVIESIARRDPAAALQGALENVRGRESAILVGEIFKIWAESDLAGSLAAARALSTPDLRKAALQVALRRQIDIEPQSALETVRELNLGDQGSELIHPAFEQWIQRDEAAARAFISGLPPGQLRDHSLFVMATSLARSRPLEALAWAQTLPEGADRRLAMLRLFDVWSSKDEAAALAAAKRLGDEGLSTEIHSKRIEQLADENLQRAMTIAGELPQAEARNAVYGKLIGKWARTDPKGAAEWAAKAGSDLDPSILSAAVALWWRANPDAARTWITALPPGQAKDAATDVLIGQLSRSNPAMAAAELGSASVETQQRAAITVARTFAAQSPKEAARWAGGLRDTQAQATALAEVARSWGRQNPAEAAAWLDGLPQGSGKDAAVSSFSRVVLSHDPEGALTWARTVTDPVSRERLICNLMAGWMEADQKSSAAWLQNAELDPSLRNRIQIVAEYLQGSQR